MNLWMIWKGILLGLGAATPIGPVNVEIARRCLRAGFRSGFLVGCGAVTVDIGYAVLAVLSIRPFLDRPHVMATLGIAGALVLMYLGVMCLTSAARRSRDSSVAAGRPRTRGAGRRSYFTGLLMTSLNPMTLAFWFVVVPGVAGQLSRDPTHDLPFVCAGVFTGAFSWVCFFSTLMALAGRGRRSLMLRLADLAGGVMLLGFAAYAVWRVAHGPW